MRYRSFVILFLLHKFRGERSVNGIYHLLMGKKSSQTVQDAKLYGVSFLFHTMSHLTSPDIHLEAEALLEKGSIIKVSENRFALTGQGRKTLQEMGNVFRFPEGLDGWSYRDNAVWVWKRLSLYVQSLSYIIYGNHRFLPVHRDQKAMEWVKHHFPDGEKNRVKSGELLYQELSHFLGGLEKEAASVYTLRLSGFHRTGRTFEQIAVKTAMDEDEVRLIFQSVMHRLFAVLKNKSARYPLLYKFSEDLLVSNVTVSTGKTYRMLQQGRSIAEILRIRGLKRGTIEDHLVELALHEPEFSIDPYVSRDQQLEIVSAIRQANSRKLKKVKERLGETVSYFAIRLVMAKTGEGKNA